MTKWRFVFFFGAMLLIPLRIGCENSVCLLPSSFLLSFYQPVASAALMGTYIVIAAFGIRKARERFKEAA